MSFWFRSRVTLSLIFIGVTLSSMAQASPMRFSSGYAGGNCSDCAWVAADGEITGQSAADLEKHLQKLQREWESEKPIEGIWLFINSPGGSVDGAIRLGRLVRDRRMDVRVARTVGITVEGAGRDLQTTEPGTCASACVIVLMGGVAREVLDGSKVGIHQFNLSRSRLAPEQQTIASTQYTVAALMGYADEMGVSPALITLASATEPSGMLWLSEEQLERSKLVTTVRAVLEAPWQLRVSGEFLSAVSFQPQPEGGAAHYFLSCRGAGQWSMTVALDPEGEGDAVRVSDIAASIAGANIAPEEWDYQNPLVGPIRGQGKAVEGLVAYSFAILGGDLASLAGAAEQQWLYLDMPNAYRSEALGGTALLPRSNLAELMPHLQRSCR